MQRDPFSRDEAGAGADDLGWIGALGTAAAFLTRLPSRAPRGARLSAAAAAFPVIGAGLGLGAGLVYVAAGWLGLGPWLGAVLAVGAAVLVTGALHEDGLADTADGFGTKGGRAARLAAMRDSRIGAFGTIALVLALGARIGGLAEIASPAAVVAALVAAGALSRAALAAALRHLPAARADGLGAAAGRPTARTAGIAMAIAAAVTVVAMLPWGWLPALLLGGAAAGVMAWRAQAAFGGHTGDVLGAIQQATEVGVICAAAAAA